MKTSDFSFELPEELIAQAPTDRRGESRLMVLERSSGSITHSAVADIRDFIPAGSIMVFNNSRVRKARLYGRSTGGGKVELLLVRRTAPDRWLVIGKPNKRIQRDRVFSFPDDVTGTVVDVSDPYREIQFSRPIDDGWLESHGHVPLPPYIHRGDEPLDDERYQTVFARVWGSVAAPTAGLHFTPDLLEKLRNHGVEVAFLTLHVGIGTFLPIRTEEIREHRMHEEEYFVPPEVSAGVTAAIAEGRPVVAVGTTAVRTLESAWNRETESLESGYGSTDLFIYPGYEFQVVRHLFTNFHTPESSLVVLVSAFAGRERILNSYREAIAERYRFFSYGDAMLIL